MTGRVSTRATTSTHLASTAGFAVLGLVAAWAVVGWPEPTRAELAPPPCPAHVATRHLDLGRRWEHEVVSASFTVRNVSHEPVELIGLDTTCSGHATHATLPDGTRRAFGKGGTVMVAPRATCEVGARFVVGAGAPRGRQEIEALVVSGPRSWPLRFTMTYDVEPGVRVDRRRLHLDAAQPSGTVKVTLADGMPFAVLPDAPAERDPMWSFARADEDSATAWTVGVLAGRVRAPRRWYAVGLRIETASGRRLRLQVPVTFEP